jgi:hypothetical protein
MRYQIFFWSAAFFDLRSSQYRARVDKMRAEMFFQVVAGYMKALVPAGGHGQSLKVENAIF